MIRASVAAASHALDAISETATATFHSSTSQPPQKRRNVQRMLSTDDGMVNLGEVGGSHIDTN